MSGRPYVTVRQAYLRGRRDEKRGVVRFYCPYRALDAQLAWDQGWEAAHQQRLKKEKRPFLKGVKPRA